MKRMLTAMLLLIFSATQVNAQIVIDGSLDAGYTLAATQTNNTGLAITLASYAPCILPSKEPESMYC